MITDFVSIIVPVFNVKKYLRKCIESIFMQTITNYELLLIDDGSTDGSGDICDEYACLNNVVVVHKANGGLSDARNVGMSIAKGEYITFVDSDDYLDKLYLKVLYDSIKETGAQIAICGHIDELEDEALSNIGELKENSVNVISSEKALEIMCYEKPFGTSAWGKLYHREVFKDTYFPKNKHYEDLATTYKLLREAEKVVYTELKLYHYVKREGSIRNGVWTPKVYDVLWATRQLEDYIKRKHFDIYDAVVFRCFFSANEVYLRAFSLDNYKVEVDGIRKWLLPKYTYLLRNKQVGYKYKAKYSIMLFFPELYKKIYMLLKCEE